MRTPILIFLFTLLSGIVHGQPTRTFNPHGPLPEGLDCSNCHTTKGWKQIRSPMQFDHDLNTGFRLTGAHRQAGCTSCHAGLRFDTPRARTDECESCHRDVHSGQFVQRCTDCHNTTSFRQIDGMTVHARTSFPLTGAHVHVTCESCHSRDRNGLFTRVETMCIGCHDRDFRNTTTIDHVASAFPTNCEQCHTTVTWQGAVFDHGMAAHGYALEGVHAGTPCSSCHTLPDMGLLFHPSSNQDCLTCHRTDYQVAHAAMAYPTDCLRCHSQMNWNASFDHGLAAHGYTLEGAHQTSPCAVCHTMPGLGLIFHPASNQDCLTCHRPDYQTAHAAMAYPTDCLRCHSQVNWNAAFDHGLAAHGYTLEGIHASTPCSSCHTMPGLGLIFHPSSNQDCLTCHRTDYQAAHAATAYPTDCLRCHSQANWNASFDHTVAANGYTLVGVHTTAPCSACHVLPGLGLIFHPSSNEDCITCHQQDFQREHGGSGYPTTCLDCHSQVNWTASFDHDRQFFPIFSGKHAGTWSTCQTCHTSPTSYRVFTCLNCHEHARAETDSKHREVTGYAYDSNLCLSCHPNGRAEEGDD